jgi:hypothetical protein
MTTASCKKGMERSFLSSSISMEDRAADEKMDGSSAEFQN